MVYSSAINGRTRYGTNTSRERPHDSGGASSDPTESRKPDHSGQASRDHPKRWPSGRGERLSTISPPAPSMPNPPPCRWRKKPSWSPSATTSSTPIIGRRLKTLKGLTPFDYIGKIWTQEPERFTSNPTYQMLGLNSADPCHLGGGAMDSQYRVAMVSAASMLSELQNCPLPLPTVVSMRDAAGELHAASEYPTG